LKREVYALYYAYRDRRTPWYAKVVAALTVAYALSPIDLIPDFIPVLGYLDDLVLIPLGLTLAVKLIPPDVMAEARDKAQAAAQRPVSWIGAVVIGLIWALVIFLIGRWIWGVVR
jgi:uncharacterized membrane protein YkvA (DUF1232 family)